MSALTDTHTHTVSVVLFHTLLLPLLLSVKTFMSLLVTLFARRIHSSPLQCAIGFTSLFSPLHLLFSPPRSELFIEAAPVTLLADIWKCFGPVLEVTVWTNRDHTSTFAMWQAFIYLPDLVYCMETPPTQPLTLPVPFIHHHKPLPPPSLFHPLLFLYFLPPHHHHLLLPLHYSFSCSRLSPSARSSPSLGRRSGWQQRAPLKPDHLSPVRVKSEIKESQAHSSHTFVNDSYMKDEGFSVTRFLCWEQTKQTDVKSALMWKN